MSQLLPRLDAITTAVGRREATSRPFWGPARLVVAVILTGTLIRLVLAATFGFGNGEAYYFSCSRHIDWSYFDHPPMHAWLARAAMELGGFHPLVLRAPFILFFAGTSWLLYLLGRKLFNAEAGLFAVVVLNLSPVFSFTTAAFLQPDSPLVFFWLLTFYGLAALLAGDKPRYATALWLGVGVSAGLTMLCKYHAVFLLLGALAYVITRKDQRHWLRHPGPYLAVALMAVAAVPVLVWNARNEWISFLWQGNRGTAYQGLHFDWLGRSIVGQALWLLPWIWVPLIRELYVCLRGGPSDRVRWLIACIATPPILFFTITAIYAPYGFHFHWQAPGYLLLFLPLGATVARLLHGSERDTRRVRRWLGLTAAVSVAAFVVLYTHTLTGWAIELTPAPYDAKFAYNDPTLEALDYSPLEKVLAERGLLDRDDLFVFTYKWFLCGKVDYALSGRAHVLCLSPEDPRAYAFFDAQADWLGKDGILIADERNTPNVERMYANYFVRLTHLADVDVPRGNRTGAKLKVFYGEKLLATVAQPYGKSRQTKFLGLALANGAAP